MFFKITFLILVSVLCCESVYVYSSFWAPLFNPRILNYKVDAKFDPDAGKNNKEEFERNYGFRGQNLIADLGKGKIPSDQREENENYGDIRAYYIYPGAYGKEYQY